VASEPDPHERFRSELPKLPRDEQPVGYRAGLQIEERLQALGVIVLGLIGMFMAYAMYSGMLPAGLPPPTPPPGVTVPVFNPVLCVTPLLGLGGIALVFVGARRFIEP
jgi:hypothetical protein